MKKNIYGFIYLIRNNINNKVYIGQTVNGFKKRYSFHGKGIERVYKHHEHLREKHSESCNYHLLSSIEKYGINNFYVDEEFDIAYSKEELDKLEDMYIKIYNSTDCKCGYNRKFGGSHGKLTIEQKQYLSKINSGENHPQYGTHMSKKSKEKLSNSLNEFYQSEQGELQKQKISKQLKDFYSTEEGKKIASNRSKKIMSNKETVEKIKQSNIDYWNKPEIKQKQSERAKQFNDITKAVNASKKQVALLGLDGNLLKVYESGSACARDLNIDFRNVSRYCKGERKPTLKYIFMFYKDYLVKYVNTEVSN